MSELRLAGASTLREANDVLSEFLPRYNTRFGVPDEGLEIDGVLCHKERRRVAKDNTVQYRGRTLQLFPDTDRPSYAGARVEVQERLDGGLLVSYRGAVLTPQEAPPLAASLRDQANAVPEDASPAPEQTPEWDHQPSTPVLGEPSSPMIWYEDSELKRRHRQLVKAGMERAGKMGKRIGRPPVTERDGFADRFTEVVELIGSGGLSLRQAAKELDIGFATLKRLLDAGMSSEALRATSAGATRPSATAR